MGTENGLKKLSKEKENGAEMKTEEKQIGKVWYEKEKMEGETHIENMARKEMERKNNRIRLSLAREKYLPPSPFEQPSFAK